jgi:hypothetical protein
MRRQGRTQKRVAAQLFFGFFQFTKVLPRFCELKNKPYKGFKSTKWLRHFVLWY